MLKQPSAKLLDKRLTEYKELLVYDATIIGDGSIPRDSVASVVMPALVLCGERSAPILCDGARAVAEALPNGRLCTLAGQGHDIVPEATAPVLTEFLSE